MKDITIGSVISDGIKDYRIDSRIGNGGFAVVYKAIADDGEYAVKVLDSVTEKKIYSFKNEFDVASKVDSEHAIRYYYFNEYGQNDFPCFLILEYANDGSLEDELEIRKSSGELYSTEELLNLYNQLLDGMVDISKVAVHRDIKPQNILVSNGIYKISDYGISKYAGEATRSVSKTMKGARSNRYYAPELWADPLGHNLNEAKVDIYAMGIVFYQIANLYYPYEDTGDYRAMHMYSAVKPFNKNVDFAFQSMIKRMLEKPMVRRYDTWEQIRDFLSNSSVGKGNKREEFVDRLLQDSANKEHAMDVAKSKEMSEHQKKVEAFRRLVGQIEIDIYAPLKGVVDAFNLDSENVKMNLSDMDIDDEDETCSFVFGKDSLKDGCQRSIEFSFQAVHSEIRKRERVIPTLSGLAAGVTYPDYNTPVKFDYKYFGETILLWGTIEADCGSGISIAIFEDKNDALYGKVKTIKRTPNVEGYSFSFPIPVSSLKRIVSERFHEIDHTIKVEEFDFKEIEYLIQINEFGEGSIRDPKPRMFRLM